MQEKFFFLNAKVMKLLHICVRPEEKGPRCPFYLRNSERFLK